MKKENDTTYLTPTTRGTLLPLRRMGIMVLPDSDVRGNILLALMQTIGLSVVSQEIKQAGMWFDSANVPHRTLVTASDSLNWLKGGGLEECIDYYHLQLRPRKIKGMIRYMFHIKEGL